MIFVIIANMYNVGGKKEMLNSKKEITINNFQCCFTLLFIRTRDL